MQKTELVFILDRSGSMCGLEGDTVGGYNGMLRKQKALEGECRVTTVLFDSSYTLLHDRVDIRSVRPITEEEYSVGGATALLDAVGKTIQKIAKVQKHTAAPFRAEKVIFVIITDGEENASQTYTSEQVKRMITCEERKYGWEFLFLGANMDAVFTAGRYGIPAERAVSYVPDSAGTRLNFEVVGQAVAAYRSGGSIPEDALDSIRRDVRKRGPRK